MKKNELELLFEHHLAKKFTSDNKKRGNDGVIYTRVSTLEQMKENGSLETQLKIDEEFAKKNNIKIVGYFGGKYESAKTDGRKEFMRMIDFVKLNLNVKYIVIANYDRFSRTGAGAAKISEDLQKEFGVIVKSVTQDIDTTTASGRLQENFFHLLNHFDNVLKSERTKVNTREIMLKGFWPYHLPVGYINMHPKKRACFHEYKLTPDAKIIKQAIDLKAQNKYSNREIIEKMKAKGLVVNEKTFRKMVSNPFYAGYITGKLVDWQLIKGHHPALIDMKTFMKANQILAKANNVNVAKKFRHEELPLKIFAKDEVSGYKLSGCRTKGIWYYKTKDSSTPLNVRADILNKLFADKLKEFEFDASHKKQLTGLITKEIKDRFTNQVIDTQLIKKQIALKKAELEKIESKYLSDSISEELFEKHSKRVKEEIEQISQELNITSFKSANLENAVDNCLKIAQNLSSAWLSAKLENKQRLQYLVFPDGLVYNKKNNEVRTLKTNSLFQSIPMAVRVIEDKKNGNLSQDCQNLPSVDLRRVELLSKHNHHKLSTRLFLY